MNYWLVRGSPAENGDFGFMMPGEYHQWRTKRAPRNWRHGDRLLFWASSPRLELISLGEFHGETGRHTPEGQVLYNVRYLTTVVDRPLRLPELRADAALQDAIFLKKGPASSVVRLSNSEGEHMYRLLLSQNSSIEGIWPDLEAHEATLPDIDDSALEGDTQLFYNDVSRSLQDSHSSRQARLAIAPKIPERISTTSTSFRRNPDVVAEVLLRAEGKCENCLQPAPFARASDGTPYLEVHHRVMLAAGGEDTVVNAIALCPNCHRATHYA